MRAIICGSRFWSDREPIRNVIKDLPIGSVIIEGDQDGADKIAGEIGEELGFPVERYPADWQKFGRRAGFIRNKKMLVLGKPDVVYAFPLATSIGTWDMVKQALRAGIDVLVYEDGVMKRKV